MRYDKVDEKGFRERQARDDMSLVDAWREHVEMLSVGVCGRGSQIHDTM